MKNKFLKPEIEIIKLLTADIVCVSDLVNNPEGYDEIGAGDGNVDGEEL